MMIYGEIQITVKVIDKGDSNQNVTLLLAQSRKNVYEKKLKISLSDSYNLKQLFYLFIQTSQEKKSYHRQSSIKTKRHNGLF